MDEVIEVKANEGRESIRFIRILIFVFAVVFAGFHLYVAGMGSWEAYRQRSIDVALIIMLAYLIYPIKRDGLDILLDWRWTYSA